VSNSGKSYQQVDPVGGYSARPVTILGCAGVVIYAIVETVIGWAGVSMPAVAFIALAATVLAAVGVVYWSSPLRAPFPRFGFATIVLLAVAAMSLDAMASWNGAVLPPGEWGPVVFGLTMVEISPYRPPRALAFATTFGGVIAGVIAVTHPATQLSDSPTIVTFIATVIPLISLGFGSAAYASALRRSSGWLQPESDLAAHAAIEELRENTMRSVQLDRAGILNRTVVPFFTEVLRRDSLSRADAAEARVISASIRALMIADVDRSWLDDLIDQIARAREDGSLPGSEVVQDSERLAAGMSKEQRIVTRVLLVALLGQPGFDPDGFAILLARKGASCRVKITAKLDKDESIQRSGLAPYFAVLRIVFGDLQVAFQSPTLTLRFSYDHR
jgi:hypothetical protein